ncbi:MAG TPA: NAD(P)H-binding protein [bacterium]|nr:NAD(P)H-binding protein [bacterium]HNI12521.1 NAD(P)H-binding protein [bacterium]HNM16167.1 NAD(P)H-binding protein [bacterium]HNO12313.1 NAD(P)H-binding protein [bacterium]HNO92506.1 NAD(P)H-binding protein [bacterium]
MKISVIGASSGVGLQCVQRALQRGHAVTTLSRSPLPVNPSNDLLIIRGSASNKEDIKKTIKDADAVLVSIGTGKSVKATTLYSDAAQVLVEARDELGTDIPFIVLTGFGAGNSGQFHTGYMKFVFRFILQRVYENKTRMETIIAASRMRWVFVRPGVLTDKEISEKYRVETRYYKGMRIGSIARSDVADFMVKQAENPSAIGQYAALSNK